MSEYTVWAPLLGVVIGGLLTLGGNFSIEWSKNRFRKKALAAVFQAEIATMLEAVARRKHIEAMEKMLSEWKLGRKLDESVSIVGNPHNDGLPNEHILISRAEFGILGAEVAAELIRYTDNVISIYRNMIYLREEEISSSFSVDGRIDLLQDDIELWKQTNRLGIDLLGKLGRISGTRIHVKRNPPC